MTEQHRVDPIEEFHRTVELAQDASQARRQQRAEGILPAGVSVEGIGKPFDRSQRFADLKIKDLRGVPAGKHPNEISWRMNRSMGDESVHSTVNLDNGIQYQGSAKAPKRRLKAPESHSSPTKVIRRTEAGRPYVHEFIKQPERAARLITSLAKKEMEKQDKDSELSQAA